MTRTYHYSPVLNRRFLLLFTVGMTFLLHGCATVYQPLPRTHPSYPQATLPPPTIPEATPPPQGAAASLYNQSRGLISQGQYRQAELTMERALRIEPKNGYYWYTMADIKYRQNKMSQAVQFCLKSKSLAGRDTRLINLNDALIRKAQ
jgi:predicted Zn-dependent protease